RSVSNQGRSTVQTPYSSSIVRFFAELENVAVLVAPEELLDELLDEDEPPPPFAPKPKIDTPPCPSEDEDSLWWFDRLKRCACLALWDRYSLLVTLRCFHPTSSTSGSAQEAGST